MAIVKLKAWYLEHYEPIREVIARPPDLRLSRNSLLKSGLRVDFLEDREIVEASEWFQRYLEGETVEFYIEGSGGYAISNIDLISHEIYFTKGDIAAWLEPTIFFSPQSECAEAATAVHSALEAALATLNQRQPSNRPSSSRLTLTLEIAQRNPKTPQRLSDSQLRQIHKSLLFVADGTPVASVSQGEHTQLLLSSPTCLELGYALGSKRPGQILLLQMERPHLTGTLPFDLPRHRQLKFRTASELSQVLPAVLETLLQRFRLFC